MRIRFAILLFFLITPLLNLAQEYKPFSNSKDWGMVSSEFFDVYYKGDNEEGAVKTAKYAEQARYELGILFDYKPDFRYSFVYVGNEWDLVYSNLSLRDEERNPGIFQMPDYQAHIVHPGSSKKLYYEVKRQLALMILDEFSYGNRIGNSIQTQLLMHNADWFRKGLAEYVSSQWTFEDELWMQSVKSKPVDLIQLAQEGDQYINRIVRKSIWHYITHEYGEQKLSEIIYLANISHSLESGIISVLGINLSTLSTRWRDYVHSSNDMLSDGRMSIEQLDRIATSVPFKEDQDIIGFSYNPIKEVFAIYTNKNGKQTVIMYDMESHQFSNTPIKSGFADYNTLQLNFNPPIAWSQDGNTLATTVFQKGKSFLVYYDFESEDAKYEEIPASLQRINQIAWSHDGKRIAISALKGGQVDIFTAKKGTADFRAITNDVYDDIEPAWSFDDQTLYFSSNRPPSEETETLANEEDYQRNFDLYSYTYQNGDGNISAITQTPTVNERKPNAINSFELFYQTDESGVFNLNKINVFLREFTYITNFSQGIDQFQSTEKVFAFSTPIGGKTALFLAAVQDITQGNIPEPSLLRLEYVSKTEQKIEAQRIKNETTIIEEPKVEEKEPEIVENVLEKNAEEETDIEADKNEGAQKPVRYYIFDEDDEPYEVKKPNKEKFEFSNTPSRVITTVFGDMAKPRLDEIEVNTDQNPVNRWKTDYLGLNLNWDPLPYNFKLGLDLRAGFSDNLNNHKVDIQLQPFIKNTLGSARYTYLKNRIDLFAQAGYMGRTFREVSGVVSDSSFFRFDQVNLNLGAIYPISSFAAVEASVGWYSIDRKDQQLQRQSLLDDQDQMLRAGARVSFDNVQSVQGYRYKGMQAQAGFDSYYSTALNDFAFHRAYAQGRHYQELYGKIVLASQVMASFNIPNTNVQYYMGGVDDQLVPIQFANNEGQAVRNNSVDTSLHNFHFLDFVMPVRGFLPNTREGSRYIVANLELRIPLSRMTKHGLNSNALYNLELIPFLDAGTVWVEGNPFSQKKPTDTQFISSGVIKIKLQTLKSPFLIGFGSGLKFNILRYSIRTDLAWGIDDSTLQRPILTLSLGRSF